MATFPDQSLPQFLLLSMALYVMECPFGQLGSGLLAVPSPKFLPTPSLLGGWGSLGKREGLDTVGALLCIAKTLVSYQRYFSHKSETQYLTGCCEDN